ncbi:S26 family signal peptidase [Candidatus Saccharibacteria bacterium]|nr:MAG: S26 family signal peptidase [Candidatus Saccharibacteria bacterium]
MASLTSSGKQSSKGAPQRAAPKKLFFGVRRVVGESMSPVLDPGRVVLVARKRLYHPEDVVVLLHKGKEKIKRVHIVHGDKYDVRGDNPSRSTDSRHFGLVEKNNILGKVIWPIV